MLTAAYVIGFGWIALFLACIIAWGTKA